MKRLPYHLVDVFTDRAFGGNALAVFIKGEGIPDATMQSIAREMNLSETTFVLAPDDPRNLCRVRIFTPGSELPMAGHPTVGTAFVLAREGLVKPAGDETTIVFEEGVGPVPVSIEWKGNAPGFIEMRQPLPKFGPRFEDAKAIAEMLSLDPRDISENLPMEVVSCGVPFLFVPINSLDAMERIRFRVDVWERVLLGWAAEAVFVFAKGGRFAGSDVHSRMFAPGLGVNEDPATGGASGPLGCYLVRYGVLSSEDELRCVSEQGVEMGRPSFLKIRIGHTGGEITDVRVGGTCHYMGSGVLELEISA
ncbi:MAG: trans-2,3-dihydro-3-hydroxyanthranilate isomerase [Verrucomicrobiota bacterium]|jgi:trans-2,3-dihydro-3-hydroxyanthranilate isomerase